MSTLSGFDYVALEYNGDGKPTSRTALKELVALAKSTKATDVLLLAHGFRNDEREASRLYESFLANFRTHLTHANIAGAMKDRRFVVGGVFWPSKKFSEGPDKSEGATQSFDTDDARDEVKQQLEALDDGTLRAPQKKALAKAIELFDDIEDDPAKQDQFVKQLLSIVKEAEPDPTEGFEMLKAQKGSELLDKLGRPVILPTVKDGEGGTAAVGGGAHGGDEGKPLFIGGFIKSAAGRVGQLLNMTTWYTMKNRSGTVGAAGVADAVRALKAVPGLRVHLIGHSLGGRCMAACAKSLSADPLVQADSLSLLEAAFSHYGFSKDNGKGARGFFRDVIDKSVVRGPLISTYSYQDTVVGKAYSIASRLADDNTKAIGDKDDQFGGIGRNGTQRFQEASNRTLGQVGDKYAFTPKVVNNLDGSGGLIKDHSDVTNREVTYAVACAIAAT
ncbi:MAG TPA: hypothetical protein VGE27_10690 [Gemmatimonas sp.]|uniref:hypothetical protein n=1 Tax=Gemmatimonas sp. TaxID=1962908 RepID=UPI002EDB87F5